MRGDRASIPLWNVQAADPEDHTQGLGRQHHDDIRRVGSVYAGLAQLFRLLRNARGACRAHSLGPAAATGRDTASTMCIAEHKFDPVVWRR
jgi:hypothetical protein